MDQITLQEKISGAVDSSDLTHFAHKTCDADLLRAMALSNPLGAALLRLKAANDHKSHAECLALLKRETMRMLDKSRGARYRLDRKLAGMACQHVLREHIFDICPVCTGAQYGLKERRMGERRKESVDVPDRRKADRRFVCPECNGTNKARQSDLLRRQELGVSREEYLAAWEQLYKDIHNIINCADAACDRELRRRMSPFEIVKK